MILLTPEMENKLKVVEVQLIVKDKQIISLETIKLRGLISPAIPVENDNSAPNT